MSSFHLYTTWIHLYLVLNSDMINIDRYVRKAKALWGLHEFFKNVFKSVKGPNVKSWRITDLIV